MKTTTITYASHDGRSTIRALLWEPDAPNDRAPLRGLVQLVHGMSEHVERYEGFAAFLCGQGYAVCANDHIGHGKTAPCREDLGHMPLEEGEDVLLQDVHALRELVIERLIASGTASKGMPYVIFGHSMGSFIARVYLTRYAHGVSAAIICGTGQQPRALAAAGKTLTRGIARARGERYVSELVDGLGAGGYANAIPDALTDVDWIATDPEVVAEYRRDPLCGQKFTVGAYHTLSSLVDDATNPRLAGRIPHGLPLYLIAGGQDPVGDRGKGVERAAAMYRRAGIERVDLKIYPGVRHEILNEPIKDEVHRDVATWLAEVAGL